MRSRGITLVEGFIAVGLVLVVLVPMALGVLDARRRARDSTQVSVVRQAQAALEIYRARTASYPGNAGALRSDEAELVESLDYAAEPAGCGATAASPCREYLLRFVLEGPIGALPGGICTARASGLSCS